MLKVRVTKYPALDPYREYWKAYGGSTALLRSMYLRMSIIILVMIYPLWSGDKISKLVEFGLNFIPTVMAFSLGSMAIILALPSDSLLNVLTRKKTEESGPSLFMRIFSNFLHFIVVQTAALILALICMTYQHSLALNFTFSFLMVYALMSIISTSAILFNAARICDKLTRNRANKDDHTST